MKIWPYDPERASEFPSSREPATEKQLSYIAMWEKAQFNLLQDIFDSVYDRGEVLTKGQATYVIKCMKGEIRKIRITDDIRRRILGEEGAENN